MSRTDKNERSSRNEAERDRTFDDASDEAWDKETLQAEADQARRVEPHDERRLNELIDEAMDLELISIRLQKGLVRAYKELAKREGIGYQPLMRQVLTRYIREYGDS